MPELTHKAASKLAKNAWEREKMKRKRWLAAIKMLTNSVMPTMLIKLQQVKSPKGKFDLICKRLRCKQELDLRGLLVEEKKGLKFNKMKKNPDNYFTRMVQLNNEIGAINAQEMKSN